MPPNRFESEVESFLEGSHGDRTHIKRADHHTVTPLCGTLLLSPTFRLCGARKSGSKLLGANFEGGQNVLVKRRLFGFVVRESGRQSWYWQIR